MHRAGLIAAAQRAERLGPLHRPPQKKCSSSCARPPRAGDGGATRRRVARRRHPATSRTALLAYACGRTRRPCRHGHHAPCSRPRRHLQLPSQTTRCPPLSLRRQGHRLQRETSATASVRESSARCPGRPARSRMTPCSWTLPTAPSCLRLRPRHWAVASPQSPAPRSAQYAGACTLQPSAAARYSRSITRSSTSLPRRHRADRPRQIRRWRPARPRRRADGTTACNELFGVARVRGAPRDRTTSWCTSRWR